MSLDRVDFACCILEVLARSTWVAGCPVKAADLRYLTMSFWGFDGRPHTGEMIVNARVADGVTAVFGELFAIKFPLEEMRVTGPPLRDLMRRLRSSRRCG